MKKWKVKARRLIRKIPKDIFYNKYFNKDFNASPTNEITMAITTYYSINQLKNKRAVDVFYKTNGSRI